MIERDRFISCELLGTSFRVSSLSSFTFLCLSASPSWLRCDAARHSWFKFRVAISGITPSLHTQSKPCWVFWFFLIILYVLISATLSVHHPTGYYMAFKPYRCGDGLLQLITPITINVYSEMKRNMSAVYWPKICTMDRFLWGLQKCISYTSHDNLPVTQKNVISSFQVTYAEVDMPSHPTTSISKAYPSNEILYKHWYYQETRYLD